MSVYMTTEAGLTRTRTILIITGMYTRMNDEITVKATIRSWRADTGVDDLVKEKFFEKISRVRQGKPRKTRGEIHCLVEMDKDRMVYTARFH